MQSNKIHIYYLLLLVPILALCLQSCIKEGEDTVSAGSGAVRFELKMTRSDQPEENDGYVVLEHEDKIKDLYVLFFSNDTQKDLLDIVKAEQYGLNEDGTNPIYMVSASKGTYHMVLLANCGDILVQAGLDEAGPDDGLTLEDFRMMLTMHSFDNSYMDGKWITDTADPEFIYMPMWGEREGVTVDSDGADLTGPNLIPLIRMVARIDVMLSDAGGTVSLAARYDIHSIRFYNWHTTGQIIPDGDAVDFTYSAGEWKYEVHGPSIPTVGTKNSDPMVYTMKPPVTEFVASIYTFETDAPDASVPGMVYEPMEYPCLVVGISEKGKGGVTRADDVDYNGTGIYYYRIDFIDNNGNWLDILRNHNYTFTITAIKNQGFPDPDQAHRSWLYDVEYDFEWQSGYEENYATGGIYRLDISETYLYEATTLNKFLLTASTTHPDGLSLYPSKYPDRIEKPQYLFIANATDPRMWEEMSMDYYYAPDIDGNILNMPSGVEYEITLEPHNPGWPTHPAGEPNIAVEYLHVVSGNLTNIITVRISGWYSN